MEKNSTTDAAPLFAGEAWFDPIEAELRERIRGFLEEMIEQEATAALGRGRYRRGAAAGYRNGTRSRRLLGSFGPIEIAVPRARLLAPDGTSREWRSAVRPGFAASGHTSAGWRRQPLERPRFWPEPPWKFFQVLDTH